MKVSKDYLVELTQEEALRFIARKERVMTRRTELLTEQAAKIKAHIAFVSSMTTIMCFAGDRGEQGADEHKCR